MRVANKEKIRALGRSVVGENWRRQRENPAVEKMLVRRETFKEGGTTLDGGKGGGCTNMIGGKQGKHQRERRLRVRGARGGSWRLQRKSSVQKETPREGGRKCGHVTKKCSGGKVKEWRSCNRHICRVTKKANSDDENKKL